MHVHSIAARVHGRFVVDRPEVAGALPMLVGFHGYAERAEDMLESLRRIRGERRWLLVSVQALNRFYTRSRTIVANWMTREDRERAIDDNIQYVADVVADVRRAYPATHVLVYAGFSQGVAMAYRAAAFAHERGGDIPAAAGAIVLAGDVPPDVRPRLGRLPPVLIGRGTQDDWYTEAKANEDLEHFFGAAVSPTVHVFEGGHVWEESFIAASAAFLDRVASPGASALWAGGR
jgi:predicted esterase